MSGNIIERPQSKRLTPIWVQQLRVVAYCRVSTGHEEQQNSLKNQTSFILNTSSEILIGGLLLFTMIPPRVCEGIIALATSSYLKVAGERRST